MLLWGPKDCGISLAHFPLPFNILSFEGSQRLILPSGVLPCSVWSCTLFPISSVSSQQCEQWYSVTWLPEIHTHVHTYVRTHAYLFIPETEFVSREEVFCKWHLHIIFFLNVRSLISEKEIRGPAHGWGVPTNMRSTRELTLILHSQAWKGSKGEAGDSQVFVDKSEHAHCLPVAPYHSQPHL